MTFNEFIKQFLTDEQCEGFCMSCGGAIVLYIQFATITSMENQTVSIHLYSVPTPNLRDGGNHISRHTKPLRTWFTTIWWTTTQKYGATAEGLQQVLGFKSYETVWAWIHKIRRAMVSPCRAKLSDTVEIDEYYIGGKTEDDKVGRGS